MSELERTNTEPYFDPHDEPAFEPIFEAEPLPVDEPFFEPADQPPAAVREPVFEAVPAQAHGVSLPVDASHSHVGWESSEPAAAELTSVFQRWFRRLQPLWAAVAVLAVVVLVALWFSLGRPRDADDEPLLSTVPVAGVVGSAVLDGAGEEQAGDAVAVTATLPQPTIQETRLGPGQQVFVANTNGQGIRLRSAPGTDTLTLGIYNDGAPFLVLSPGGDYDNYPVEADGYYWYRIRVVEDPADQLVGWAAGDYLMISEP